MPGLVTTEICAVYTFFFLFRQIFPFSVKLLYAKQTYLYVMCQFSKNLDPYQSNLLPIKELIDSRERKNVTTFSDWCNVKDQYTVIVRQDCRYPEARDCNYNRARSLELCTFLKHNRLTIVLKAFAVHYRITEQAIPFQLWNMQSEGRRVCSSNLRSVVF